MRSWGMQFDIEALLKQLDKAKKEEKNKESEIQIVDASIVRKRTFGDKIMEEEYIKFEEIEN